MKLKKYKYGNTEFDIDISRNWYIAKDGSRSIVIFSKCTEQVFITFESYSDRNQFCEDIFRDIEGLNKSRSVDS